MAILTAGRIDLGAPLSTYTIEADANRVVVDRDPISLSRTVIKFDQRSDSADYGGHPRSEVRLPAWSPQAEVWLYWQTLLRSEDFRPDDRPHTLIFQVHQTPDGADAAEGEPPLSFLVRGKQLTIKGAYDATATSTSGTPTTMTFGRLPIPFDEWVSFVVRAKFDWTASGLAQIWMNGKQVVNYTGPLAYNDALGCYAKMGVYCSGGVTSRLASRVAYGTGFTVGDSSSSYSEVTGGLSASGWRSAILMP